MSPLLLAGDRRFTCRALVFDKDGVLQDFDRHWIAITEARARALALEAGDPSLEPELRRGLGLSPEGRVLPGGLLAVGSRQDSTLASATFLHMHGMPWPMARQAAYRAFEAAEDAVDLADSCQPLPGVPETLRRLRAAGFRLAIATTDETAGAQRFLERHRLDSLFDAVVGVDRVRVSKPDPAMFLLACELAGVEPAEALMIGDGEMDLRMGRAGGAAGTIGVLSGVGDRDGLAPHADALLPGAWALAPEGQA